MALLRCAAGLTALLLIMNCTAAGVAGLPRFITIGEEAEEISFTISNDSRFGSAVGIEFDAPTQIEIKGKPEFLKAGESAFASIVLQPNQDLGGSSYSTTLVVTIGSERIKKGIKLSFAKTAGENGLEGNSKSAEADQNSTKFFAALFSLPDFPSLDFGSYDFGGVLALVSWELALDILLVVIAAILLLAFIARVVHIMAAQQGTHATAESGESAYSGRAPKGSPTLDELRESITKGMRK